MRWQKLYNPMVSWLLRSPLHGLISSSTMLISYTGRESGRTYTTPVNYVWDGDTLLVVSPRDRIWWRNLRVESPVTVCVAGRDLRGVGRAFEGEDAVREGGLLTVLRGAPTFRRYCATELKTRGKEHMIALSDGSEAIARTVIIAAGVAYRRIGVASLERLVGVGVFYGAAAVEAPAMAGEEVYVVGGANSAGQAALHLAKFGATLPCSCGANRLRPACPTT